MERWNTMPVVTAVNRLVRDQAGRDGAALRRRTARGATIPCSSSSATGAARPSRFTPQDSWVWQMHATMAVEDLTHENFWRQLLRWVVDEVPDQVEIRMTSDRVEPGSTVAFTASVSDKAFLELNDASVTATVDQPRRRRRRRADGVERREGRRVSGQLRGEAPGWYEVRAVATRAGTEVGSAVAARARRAGRAGVLRRDAAGRHAAPHGRRDRRPLLRGGGHRHARRRPALHRARRDHRRGARALAHADRR